MSPLAISSFSRWLFKLNVKCFVCTWKFKNIGKHAEVIFEKLAEYGFDGGMCGDVSKYQLISVACWTRMPWLSSTAECACLFSALCLRSRWWRLRYACISFSTSLKWRSYSISSSSISSLFRPNWVHFFLWFPTFCSRFPIFCLASHYSFSWVIMRLIAEGGFGWRWRLLCAVSIDSLFTAQNSSHIFASSSGEQMAFVWI